MNNKLTIPSEQSMDALIFGLIKAICKQEIKIFHKNNGIPDNFFTYLSDTTIDTTPPSAGIWRKNTKSNYVYQKEMFASAVEMFSSQAIILFTEMVINGDFNQPGKRKIVFIKEMYDHKPLMLIFGSKITDHPSSSGVFLKLEQINATDFFYSNEVEWYGCE